MVRQFSTQTKVFMRCYYNCSSTHNKTGRVRTFVTDFSFS